MKRGTKNATGKSEINIKEMTDNNQRFPFNDIHPSAVIYEGVEIGKGNTIGPFCIIGAPAEWKGRETAGRVIIGNNNRITGHVTIDSGATDMTRIGSNCYIMKSVHCGHDAQIHDDVTLSCHSIIGGHTVINEQVNVGLGAIIHQKQIIAKGCMIGMGAIITKNLITEEFSVYVGNPAKLLGENKKHPNYETYIINQRQTL